MRANAGQLLIAGTIAFLGYSLIRKQSGAEKLTYYPAGVKNISFEGISPVMTLRLAVQNTSNQTFTLNSIAGNVFCDDTLIGNASNFIAQTVNRNSQTIFEIKVKLSPLGIVNEIIQAFQYGNFSKELEFEGYANLDNWQVPINLKFKVGS